MSYAAKRILNSNVNNNQPRQSIKFQIEVPMNMSYSASENDFNTDYDLQYDNNNIQFIRGAHERRSIQLKKQTIRNESLNNQTICFKISIDSNIERNRNGSIRNLPVSVEKASSITSGAPSSGYSSSLSNSSSMQFLDDQFEPNNNAFCSDYPVKTPMKSLQNPLFCNENIYDKLSYSNKKRCSIASLISSSTESSASSSSSSSSECDIYEDITNFTQGEVIKKQHIYCNEQLNNCNKLKFFKRREYTVNEIFQNAKCFQEEAKKQEVNQMVNIKSVNILKQLFEDSNSNKKAKMTAASSPAKVQKCAMILRKPRVEKLIPKPVTVSQAQMPHVYINEKISKAVIV